MGLLSLNKSSRETPPVPEEAVEIIPISLCHFGTKGNRVDKKRKGASRTQGVEVKVSRVGALPRELCQAPGFISKGSLQRWENPGDFSSHSQISGFHRCLLRWVLVIFTMPSP